ncbi:MAG TPA: LEA type 2 family protein [Chitinophagaceae bacterium]|nr:LEA type 2 family protein [Chitinophagaceae bacterium]
MKALISTLSVFLLFLASCSSFKNVQEPQYRDIQNVRLIKVGLLQTTAGVDLVYYNPNDFGIQLTNARGDVYIDNDYFGHFQLDENVKVGKRSEFILPVVFKLDNVGAIKNQRDIYKKKEALVKIEGHARVQKAGFSKEIPIRFERVENIEKFRAIVASR